MRGSCPVAVVSAAVAAACFPDGSPERERRRAGVARQEVGDRAAGRFDDRIQHTEGPQPAGRGDDRRIAVQQTDRRLQERRQQPVVAVQHGHAVGPRRSDADVARGGRSGVPLPDDGDVVRLFQFVQHLYGCLIRRPVVHHDARVRTQRLPPDRIDGLANHLVLVVAGDDHTDVAHARHYPPHLFPTMPVVAPVFRHGEQMNAAFCFWLRIRNQKQNAKHTTNSADRQQHHPQCTRVRNAQSRNRNIRGLSMHHCIRRFRQAYHLTYHLTYHIW